MSAGSQEKKARKASLWLLAIPVAALIFPNVYNRESPTLFGFPFFYWYQLAWVFLTTGILALVYRMSGHSGDSSSD